MENLRWGTLIAALVAGPTLWSLVSAGDLSSETALVRWGAVVAVCTLGIAGLRRIVADYEAQAQRAAIAAEQAPATSERVVLEGTTLPADVPPPPAPAPRPPHGPR